MIWSDLNVGPGAKLSIGVAQSCILGLRGNEDADSFAEGEFRILAIRSFQATRFSRQIADEVSINTIRFSYVAGIAAILLTVGCGGSKNKTKTTTPSTGAVTFSSAPATTLSASRPATTPFTTTLGGRSTVIAGGSDFGGTPIGGTADYAIIPAGTGFAGAFGATSEVIIGGTPSGGTVGTDGFLDKDLAVPASSTGTPYTLSFPGGTITTRDLTVGSWTFSGKFYVGAPRGLSVPIPYAIAGTIPNNGQNAKGADVTASFLNCNGRSATLTIYYTSNHATGFKLQQTQIISGNTARFRNLTTDAVNVPNTGVDEVNLTVGDF